MRTAPSDPGLRVLITGATDGLGLALAETYHRAGAQVIGVGRRGDLEGRRCLDPWGTYCRADVGQAGAAEVIDAELEKRRWTTLDRLILNAAVGSHGELAALGEAAIDEQLAVNLLAPLRLAHRLLPRLAPRRGCVVFVGSVAAALPAPDYAVYAATKAALDGFARSLRVELADRVAVQVIHPGPMRTAFHRKVGVPATMDTGRFADPGQVSRRAHRAIEGGRRWTAIGGPARVLMWLGRHLPGLVGAAVRRRRGR